jgi:ribosome recycling factor
MFGSDKLNSLKLTPPLDNAILRDVVKRVAQAAENHQSNISDINEQLKALNEQSPKREALLEKKSKQLQSFTDTVIRIARDAQSDAARIEE